MQVQISNADNVKHGIVKMRKHSYAEMWCYFYDFFPKF